MQQDRILDIWIRIRAIIKKKLADVWQSNLVPMYTGVRDSGLREDISEEPTNTRIRSHLSKGHSTSFGFYFFI